MIRTNTHQNTLEEFQEGMWLTMYPRWAKSRLLSWIFTAVLFFMGLYLIVTDPLQRFLGTFAIVMSVIMATFQLGRRLIVNSLARKLYRNPKNALYRSKHELEFDETGFRGSYHTGATSQLPWQDFQNWTVGQFVTVIWFTETSSLTVAHQAFSNEKDVSSLHELLTSKLGPPKN